MPPNLTVYVAKLTHVVSFKPVSHPAQLIANAFLAKASEQGAKLTNMQVQKLVYFAHGYHLAIKDAPLVADEIKAWNFGPVIPPLYNDLKRFGNGFVTDPIAGFVGEIGDFDSALVAKIFELYGRISGPRLSAATHVEGSPWDITYKRAKFSIIPNDLIRDYFKSKLRRPVSAGAA